MLFSLTSSALALFLSSIPLSQAADIPVTVGGAGILKFDPESVTAAVGDRVLFQFREKNHTATQSTFASPCVKAPGGFDSGFQAVAPGATGPVAEFVVTSTDPVWVYCAQGTHCSAGGMVFAINPADRFAAFKAAATGQAPPPTTSPTPPTGGKDVKVVVGGPGKLVFDPPSVKAQPGDTITFEFRQKSHTVTQSTFASPCTLAPNGFNSGPQPVADGATTFPTWQIKVNDTNAIWAFCQTGNHCAQGMVFAVNAPDTGNTFDAFKTKATGGTPSGTTPSETPAPNSGAIRTSASLTAVVAALVALALH
jgi:plastocyanin